MFLYLTADKVGTPTGGGAVTYHEVQALTRLGVTKVLSRDELTLPASMLRAPYNEDPWLWDNAAYSCFGNQITLAHVYAGTFTDCVKKLKDNGAKVVYTAAAHDVELSRIEHEKLGLAFSYPHLTDPLLWKRYVGGYLNADVLVCPSKHSANVMRRFGFTKRIEIIPHGVHIPESVADFPAQFVVGYLGAIGPDKGLRYLLEAWGKLNYPNAKLVLAGPHSQSPFVQQLVNHFAPGRNIELRGWVENISDFYNSISVYVQPSVTEGFGIEVLEAMAHGRPVICSTGAGAADVMVGLEVPACDSPAIAMCIDTYWMNREKCLAEGAFARQEAQKYTWDRIEHRYMDLWNEVLNG